MIYHLKLFILSMIIFFMLDMLWIGYFAKDIYFKHYGLWLRLDNGQLQPVWWAILIVYALFALGTLFLVLPLAQSMPINALLYGALMGFVIYGIYDFTCLAIFKDWPKAMAFVDWAWGTLLCAASACITAYLSRMISR